jgi:hypothetical protein
VRGLLATLASQNGWTLAEFAWDATPDGMQRMLHSEIDGPWLGIVAGFRGTRGSCPGAGSGRTAVGVVRARAFSLDGDVGVQVGIVERTLAWPSQRAVTQVLEPARVWGNSGAQSTAERLEVTPSTD